MDKKNPNHSSNSSSDVRPLSLVQVPSGETSGNQQNSRQDTLNIRMNQPRQPSNLQGLLRFATEVTAREDAPNPSLHQPMDEERKKFLKEALDSLTVNVIEEIQKDIKKLQNICELRNEDDPSEYEAALERISDYADSMDVANDFYKIGGFSILAPCLNSPFDGIRWRVADLIAELTQNNLFCQENVLRAGLMPILLLMVDTDPCDLARIKSLYAVSCIVRGHPEGLKYMEKHDGFSILMRAIQSPIEKLQIKSAFLLSSLCSRDNDNHLKSVLLKMGLIEQAAGLLAMGNLPSETREQLLAVLSALSNNNYLPSLIECRRPELCLKQTLERHLREAKEEGSLEREDLCKELLDKLFLDQDNIDQER